MDFLKRDLLLFEHLAVVGLTEMITGDGSRRDRLDDRLTADCLYLMDEKVLSPAPDNKREIEDWISHTLWELGWDRGVSILDDVWPRSDANPLTLAEALASSSRHPASLIGRDELLPIGGELVIAYVYDLLADNTGEAVALFSSPPPPNELLRCQQSFFMHWPEAQADSAVAEVVIRNLPFPGEEVPLADVLDFVRDPSTKRQITSLRHWMAKMAMLDQDRRELENQADSMLHDFKQHMELADMRSSDSNLRLAVSIPLAFVEELVHLKPKSAFDALFGIRARQANRLEAQLTSPGHEMAYVRTAQEHFGSSAR